MFVLLSSYGWWLRHSTIHANCLARPTQIATFLTGCIPQGVKGEVFHRKVSNTWTHPKTRWKNAHERQRPPRHTTLFQIPIFAFLAVSLSHLHMTVEETPLAPEEGKRRASENSEASDFAALAVRFVKNKNNHRNKQEFPLCHRFSVREKKCQQLHWQFKPRFIVMQFLCCFLWKICVPQNRIVHWWKKNHDFGTFVMVLACCWGLFAWQLVRIQFTNFPVKTTTKSAVLCCAKDFAKSKFCDCIEVCRCRHKPFWWTQLMKFCLKLTLKWFPERNKHLSICSRFILKWAMSVCCKFELSASFTKQAMEKFQSAFCANAKILSRTSFTHWWSKVRFLRSHHAWAEPSERSDTGEKLEQCSSSWQADQESLTNACHTVDGFQKFPQWPGFPLGPDTRCNAWNAVVKKKACWISLIWHSGATGRCA